jgi:hypothetical protein
VNVRQWHYNRENNEVVELLIAHQTTPVFMLLRKTESEMRIGSVSHSLLMLIVGGVASLILGTGSAQAAPRAQTDLVEFEKMTWVEVRAALAVGKTTALIYTGGVEERGRPTRHSKRAQLRPLQF